VLLRTAPALAIAAALCLATVSSAGSAPPSVREAIGQLMLVRMHGRAPSTLFLARIRRGEIGGVVLFADNYGPRGPARLVATLQRAARQGRRPPLLIAIDQEGGLVKRLPGAPSFAPSQMRSAPIAEAQGFETARNLRQFGVNLDLAPVLDVGRGGFITPRAFGSTPAQVAARGPAFALGLARGGVVASGKHFPGLGYATRSTDASAAPVRATRVQLLEDLAPFRAAIMAGIGTVMVSTAVYTSLAPRVPAADSSAIVSGLLRERLGFRGVVVSDALKTPAVNRYFSTPDAARRAVAAGVDLVLAAGGTGDYADTDGASISTYDALVEAVRSGSLAQATVRSAYSRVLALKARLPDELKGGTSTSSRFDLIGCRGCTGVSERGATFPGLHARC
jgi:beta-N-acetylhexosaminidase